jgi:hypothetical protein
VGETVRGVEFPATDDGDRSTSALGRTVVADALRAVDPAGAFAAEQETNWRAGYLRHVRRLTEAGLAPASAASTIASDGLGSFHARMRFVDPDGGEVDLGTAVGRRPTVPVDTAEVVGRAEPERELTLPYRGERLRGDDLRRQLATWVDGDVLEPSCAEAVARVLDHPEWLSVPDHTVVVLGAGAEMGPLPSLLRWGARVAGVDLPRPDLWQRVLTTARDGAGTLLVPVPAGWADDDPAEAAGVDLVRQPADVAAWMAQLDGPLVLGNYVYADGRENVRVAGAVDAVTMRLLEERPDEVSLAFLATPTDVFAVPPEAVAASVQAYEGRSRTARVLGRPLRTLSGGRLLRRAYLPGSDPGICDALVAQQGPNYALAKRLQRWRATVAREAGATVSMNVAPATRTRSVVKNRALAAAYAGAHRFGVEVFDPSTSNTLMAALLVHDLHTGGGPRHEHPWQDEAYAAAHGGLWRAPYAPRSVLGLAAILGFGSAT